MGPFKPQHLKHPSQLRESISSVLSGVCFGYSVTAQMIQDGYNNVSEVIRAGLRMLVDLDPAAI